MKYIIPDTKELRKFGIVMFTAFLVLSVAATAIGWWLKGEIGLTKVYVLNGIGIFIFLLPGLLIPDALAPVHKYWMKFGMALGWVNQRIILSIVWYFVFTPVSIVQKIIKRDPMRRTLSKDADTYWIDRSQEKPKPKHFERQF